MIKIGADPELFLSTEDGRAVPADMFFPGTKENPVPIPGGAVQVDGTAVEFNINPSSDCRVFLDNINRIMAHLHNMVPPNHKLSNNSIQVIEHPHRFDINPACLVRGCAPDYDAYSGAVNPEPEPDRNFGDIERAAAGHIHIGFLEEPVNPTDRDHVKNCRNLVIMLDEWVGIPTICMADQAGTLDQERRRRLQYGKAGCFRPKYYGLEYRTPSNIWLFKDNWRRFIFSQAHAATSFFLNNGYGQNSWREESIQETINEALANQASVLMQQKEWEL